MIIFFVVFLGLCIGSFLNVCIYRIPRKLSIVKPLRSFCPSCEKEIPWHNNIPVISWLFLRAKCSNCHTHISGQYPLVELLSAIAAAESYIRFGATPTALIIYALAATLITISFIDLEFKIIPNVISFPGITFGLCLGILSQFTEFLQHPLTSGAADSLFGMLAGGGSFYLVGLIYYSLTKRVGLGGGDVKLLAMTGAILGVQSVLPTIFTGALIGSVIGITMMVVGRGGRHTEIPFGPWLSLGALLYMYADVNLFKL